MQLLFACSLKKLQVQTADTHTTTPMHTRVHALLKQTYAFWVQLYTIYFLGLITAFLCCCRGFVQLKASYQHGGSFLILILLATDRNSSFDMTVSKYTFIIATIWLSCGL